MGKRPPIHADKGDIGFRHRSAFKLLTATNGKTPKGEKVGYFTGLLYLSPHTSGRGPTVCPHSTPDCREMCLSGSGLSGLPKAQGAKLARTAMFNDQRERFIDLLLADIEKLKRISRDEDMAPALRLNGTSDLRWERIIPGWNDLGLQRYDYTKFPLEHRRITPGYHITFSIEGPRDMVRALDYLAAGHNVAAVVPEELKERAMEKRSILKTFHNLHVVDGDEHDLRFLDPPGSLVLLKPKGHIRTGLIRPKLFQELAQAAKETT